MTNLDIAKEFFANLDVNAAGWELDDEDKQWMLEDSGDVADFYTVVKSETLPADSLFAFGEFASFIVLVEDGKVVSWAVGGFDDNRGESTDFGYAKESGEDNGSNGIERVYDADYEDSKVWEEIYAWLKG